MSGYSGRNGKPGPQGPAGTITIAPTVVGTPGSAPSVRNIGGVSNAVLEFTLSTGAKGDQGIQGPQPMIGTPLATQVAEGGQPTAQIAGEGTSADPYVITFGIPKGDTGQRGPQPVFGQPTAVTVPAGGQASAGITGSGSSTNPYILELGLPTGATGAQGPDGYPGAISGTGIPTGDADMIGQTYWDSTNQDLYVAVSVEPTVWTKVIRAVDTAPTQNSTNLVESGGVYDALGDLNLYGSVAAVSGQYPSLAPNEGYDANEGIKVKQAGLYFIASFQAFQITSTVASKVEFGWSVNGAKWWMQTIDVPAGTQVYRRLCTSYPITLAANDVVTPILHCTNSASPSFSWAPQIALALIAPVGNHKLGSSLYEQWTRP